MFSDADDEVYHFLNRLSLKQIITFNDETLPLSRLKIAGLLVSAGENKDKLNELDREELEWYLREFFVEAGKVRNNGVLGKWRKAGIDIGGVKDERTGFEERWYPFSYTDSLFDFKVYPIAGYGISSTGKASGHSKTIGAGFWGTYSDWFGASFEYKDMGEFGGNVNYKRDLSPRTGFHTRRAPNGVENSDVRGSITLSLPENLGYVSLRKDYNLWGHGKTGQLIISDKPASFPHLYLFLQPADWFRFSYFHGWLNSLIPDSNSFYYNHWDSEQPNLRRQYVPKYIAANMFTFTPWKWLDFSLGNAVVYSGELRPEMFIPFMYYKVMDHNTGREGWDDGNGQIFFDVKVNYLKNFSFYSTLLIDVLEIRPLLKGDWYKSWFGYTVGGMYTDVIIPNLDLNIEYTKTNPWVYENNDESTTYKHLNFPLGHWIGGNADLLTVRLDYQVLRGLRVSLEGERFRKGGMMDVITNAYKNRKEVPFLYSPVRIEKSLTLSARYEPIYDLVGEMYYQYSNVSDEDKLRTPDWQLGVKHSFGVGIRYGM